jgi:L,D-transpeptidase catalytic domain
VGEIRAGQVELLPFTLRIHSQRSSHVRSFVLYVTERTGFKSHLTQFVAITLVLVLVAGLSTHVGAQGLPPLAQAWFYGIHGTNAPLSIYGFQSRGCIRMHPEDAGALFRQVKVGQPGEIICEPVLLAQLPGRPDLSRGTSRPIQKKGQASAAICS